MPELTKRPVTTGFADICFRVPIAIRVDFNVSLEIRLFLLTKCTKYNN